MQLAKAVLFLVVIVSALAAAATAQTVPERNAADTEERSSIVEPSAGRAVLGARATARLVNAGIPTWLRDYPLAGSAPGVAALFAPSALPAGARFVTPRNPQPRVLRVINGRFVPIPLLQWRTRVPLDSRAMLAVSPSIFIGRRPRFMPEGFRGGRTLGFAVHVRINLNQPAASQSAAPGSRTALLASKVRALLASR